ncbi:MAG: hypothetical protein U1E36_07325 [Rickettsiales bacterium]
MVTLIPENEANTGRGALIVYLLYLAGFLTGFITNLVGLVMAYVNSDDQPEWLQTHYQYQIRTFWIGLLYSTISAILVIVLIGKFLLILDAIWLIIRCAKGIKWLDAKKPVPNPKTWVW